MPDVFIPSGQTRSCQSASTGIEHQAGTHHTAAAAPMRHARFPWLKLLTGLAIVFGGLMVVMSELFVWVTSPDQQFARWALAGGTVGVVFTALGALFAVLVLQWVRVRASAQALDEPDRWKQNVCQVDSYGSRLREAVLTHENIVLSFAAGMMLCAAMLSLLMPGVETAIKLYGVRSGVGIVWGGFCVGLFLIWALSKIVSTTIGQHRELASPATCGSGSERNPLSVRGQVKLFVTVIALHNIPEGMAVGASLAQGDLAIGLPVVAAIAIQNLPEGVAVALALVSAGSSMIMAVVIACVGALLEPVGAVLAVAIVGNATWAMWIYPAALAFAGAAMLYVVTCQVIPATLAARGGLAVWIAMGLGVLVMVAFDFALG